ncbi:MAG: M42 family peptidase, partial [Myxococcota bacterium]
MRKGSTGFLESLLGAVSVSGSEAPVQRVWLDYAGQFADRTETDSYGNCYAYLNGGGSPRIMISGHADEIGFLVQYISDDGFIHFAAAGGVDRALIPGRRMIVQTRKGPVTGVTGALAIHMQDKEKERPPQKVHENFLDIGAASKAEAEKRVQIGDVITYADGFTRLAGDVVAARGCDNRIGIWAAAETLRLLKNQKKINACVVAVSTVQEEIGHNGAFMAGHNVKPDISLVADVGHATDI